ncbi:MAG: hypothetical protein PHX47_03095 [Candidatus ainarchaeum sp.]|nr:hypothetical protein [Candidatus ainarchaeum sp.]
MINEKLIEIINDLKNKRLSDIEIIDILLLNNYNIEEIKENLTHYNEIHGYSSFNYIDKYEKIQGKKFFDNNERLEETKQETPTKKEVVKENKKEEIKEPVKEIKKEVLKVEKAKKKMKIGDFIGLIAIVILLAFIIYVILNYDVIGKLKAAL